MSLGGKDIYALLPAIYRTRDAQNGSPLEALMCVIGAQAAILDDNIKQLYADAFIETCASWVIPYIGDLIGIDPIYEVAGTVSGQRRAEVANTIGYRRRKGTLLNLEQVCMDASGMTALGLEFFRHLITTQSMRHPRPGNEATLNLRQGPPVRQLQSPFDSTTRTIDVRRIAPRVRKSVSPDPAALEIALHGGGRFNIPDVGIYLWRWQLQPVTAAPAFQIDATRYTFSPLGHPMPLFNQPLARTSFDHLTGRMDIASPIDRHEFARSISTFYGQSFQLIADGAMVDASQICCCDLSAGTFGPANCVPPGKIAIDPETGRIRLAADVTPPNALCVSYAFGSGGNIGGGPYDRSASFSQTDPQNMAFVALVGSAQTPTLESAIAAWNQQPPGASGAIFLPNFESYSVEVAGQSAIQMTPQSQLWIVAAQPHAQPASPTTFTYAQSFVTLRGNIEIQGAQPEQPDGSLPPGGQVCFSGLWIAGAIKINGQGASVQLMDCTLVPGIWLDIEGNPALPGEPSIVAGATQTTLGLTRCISGPISAAGGGTTRICSSIIDSTSSFNVAYAGADLAGEGVDLHVEDSTLIGKVRTRTMQMASNTIFVARRPKFDGWEAAVWCSRKQAGCMRFCFIPSDSIIPRQFQCLPDAPENEAALAPSFITLRYGLPSYAMLSGYVPMAVWTGADDGAEMGTFHMTAETQAVRNVQIRAAEYLPFGLEAGIFLEPSRPLYLPHEPSVYGYAMPNLRGPVGDEFDELQFIGIGAHLL